MIKHGKLWAVWLYGIMTVKVQVHLTKPKVQWRNEASQHHNHRDMLIGPLQWPAKRVGVERFCPQHWSNGDRFGTGLWVLLMIPDSGWLTLMLELRHCTFFSIFIFQSFLKTPVFTELCHSAVPPNVKEIPCSGLKMILLMVQTSGKSPVDMVNIPLFYILWKSSPGGFLDGFLIHQQYDPMFQCFLPKVSPCQVGERWGSKSNFCAKTKLLVLAPS